MKTDRTLNIISNLLQDLRDNKNLTKDEALDCYDFIKSKIGENKIEPERVYEQKNNVEEVRIWQ